MGWPSGSEAAENHCSERSGPCFVLTGVQIDGVSVYPAAAMANFYSVYLAREVGMADLVRIATAITDQYRADGYFLSRAVVPGQTFDGGIAHIRVYEGYVSEVAIVGEPSAPMERMLRSLTEVRPLRLRELERRLSVAADAPAVKLTTRIEPDIDNPAAHRLRVTIDRTKASGSLSVDNRGTRGAGPWEAYLRGSFDSIFEMGDRVTAGAQTIPDRPKEFVQGDLGYAIPLDDGATLSFSGALAQTNSDQVAIPSKSTGRNLSVGLSLPIERSKNFGLWTGVSLDARHVEQDASTGSQYSDDLRVIRLWMRAEDRDDDGNSNASVQMSYGLPGLGASKGLSLTHSRADADGRFLKFSTHAARYQDVGSYAGIYVAADGQWSNDPLLASEEFTVGGVPYGRAYDYAELSGDDGGAVTVELRMGANPEIGPVTFLQAYGFGDVGETWNKSAPPNRQSKHLASAGGGLLVTLLDKFYLRLEAAKPLTQASYAPKDRGWRYFFSLLALF